MKATEAMLEPDIGYRLAHHDDLQWRPTSNVTEASGGIVFEDGIVRVSCRARPTTLRYGRHSASASTREVDRW